MVKMGCAGFPTDPACVRRNSAGSPNKTHPANFAGSELREIVRVRLS